MKQYMPEFNSEEEFEEYFKEQTEYLEQFRDSDGILTFKSQAEFIDTIVHLFEMDMRVN